MKSKIFLYPLLCLSLMISGSAFALVVKGCQTYPGQYCHSNYCVACPIGGEVETDLTTDPTTPNFWDNNVEIQEYYGGTSGDSFEVSCFNADGSRGKGFNTHLNLDPKNGDTIYECVN